MGREPPASPSRAERSRHGCESPKGPENVVALEETPDQWEEGGASHCREWVGPGQGSAWAGATGKHNVTPQGKELGGRGEMGQAVPLLSP